jgi:predicted SnoaL-like aldol condensation-catalyzing enzyme
MWPTPAGGGVRPQDLEYEDVTFPALDGVPLEAWFIPAGGSDKLIIANHPMGFSRPGIPAHLEPWKSIWALSGNDFEVNLVPDYKILHDAGYNVLAYDLSFIGFVRWLRGEYPHLKLDIKRVIAEGDMVVTHSHLDLEPRDADNPGRALADFFRLEDGKVVEHWDVIQDVPRHTANPGGMF